MTTTKTIAKLFLWRGGTAGSVECVPIIARQKFR